jgi:hypothetical protein
VKPLRDFKRIFRHRLGVWLFSIETDPGPGVGNFYRTILTPLLQERETAERILDIELT